MNLPSKILEEIAVVAKKHGFILENSILDKNQKNSFLIRITQPDVDKKTTPITPATHDQEIHALDGKLNAEYLIANAKILISAAEYDSASTILRAIVCSGRKTSEVCLLLGRCYESLSRDELASNYYEESIAFLPSIEAYQRLSGLWMKAKNYSEAAKILDRAFQSKAAIDGSIKTELLKAAGNCWAKSGHFDLAIDRYQKALHLDPSLDCVQANLGVIYFCQGKISESKQFFLDAWSANPKNSKAALGLAYVSLKEGHRVIAHDYLVLSLNLNILQPDAIFHLIKTSLELKTYSSAARILEEYVEMAPFSVHLLYVMAGIQFLLGRKIESKNSLRRIFEIQPDYSPAIELQKWIQLNESKESSWRTVNHGKHSTEPGRMEARSIE